jgi:hypothetical protein
LVDTEDPDKVGGLLPVKLDRLIPDIPTSSSLESSSLSPLCEQRMDNMTSELLLQWMPGAG